MMPDITLKQELTNLVNNTEYVTDNFILETLGTVDPNIIADAMRERARIGKTSIMIYVTYKNILSRSSDDCKDFNLDLPEIIRARAINEETEYNMKYYSKDTQEDHAIDVLTGWLQSVYSDFNITVTTGITQDQADTVIVGSNIPVPGKYKIVTISWE